MDLIGREVSVTERRLLALYGETKALLERPDLAPGVRANLKASLAHLRQIMNNLDLGFDQLYDYEI